MKPESNRVALVAVGVLVVIGTAVAARRSRAPAGADITEGGSPLYKIAVDESIKGLHAKKGEKPEAQGGACPQCGKVHASPAPVRVGTPAAPAAQPAAAEGVPCAKCGKVHPAPHAVPVGAAAAHSAAGASRGYVYCSRCKVYHRRQPQPGTAEAGEGSILQPLGLDLHLHGSE